MEKKNPDWLLLIAACGLLASWVSGCANHGKFGGRVQSPDSAQTDEVVAKSQDIAPASKGIAGTWLCDDAECAAGTIKKISDKLDSIETLKTERLAPTSPHSICRIQETEHLSALSATDHFSLTEASISLVRGPENTQDCADMVEKLNQSKPLSVDIEIIRDAVLPELSIGGVRYRKLSEDDLRNLSEKRAQMDARYASVAGEWACIEDGCGDLQQKISDDRRTVTATTTIQLQGDGLKCHVAEDSKMEILDDTEPQRLYIARVRTAVKLVDSVENLDVCSRIVRDFNERRGASEDPERITIERDGNQEIIFLGKRYARKGTNS